MYNVRCKYAKLQTSVPHTKKTAATLHFLHQLTFSSFFFQTQSLFPKFKMKILNSTPQFPNSATKPALTLYM